MEQTFILIASQVYPASLEKSMNTGLGECRLPTFNSTYILKAQTSTLSGKVYNERCL